MSIELSRGDENWSDPSLTLRSSRKSVAKRHLSRATEPLDSLMGIQSVSISGIGKKPFELVNDQIIKPSLLLRRLADFGYEKVSRLSRPGEFRFLGDVVDILPFSCKDAYRIEFLGNQIETITILPRERYDEPEGLIEAKIAKTFFQKIQPGDYVVHLDHGIGRFRETRIIDKETYLLLEYARGDKLFVPEKAFGKLTPYIGFGTPKITSLKGAGWLIAKRKISEETGKLARELLILYARRAIATRRPYHYDEALEKEFASLLGYNLTNDQVAAIEEIKRDLGESIPMDRLVCGDVGFGKTEVALRAAFLMICQGKQVVFLTPTTILADQHYHYIKERFEPFGVLVSLISRAAREGDGGASPLGADLFVGTHKLFSFIGKLKKLGLVIIDEEQRFGVRQKERFKELRANVDILSLSATPIPRTFQLALAGLRDISNILHPFSGKEPISTYAHPFDEHIIERAIQEELARQGQVYYLVPRIKDIPAAMVMLKKFFPKANIAFAHGKLPEDRLLKVMHDFRKKRYDILAATTIIENGLDLENVNTLVVQNAEKLGLAQAHQIRGRVGRRSQKAKAYFLYNPKQITEDGKRRLAFLTQFQGLGENYEIAMKDLEVRGMGNILGKEQSGSIRTVGLHLYNEMLKEAVGKLKSNPPAGGEKEKTETQS